MACGGGSVKGIISDEGYTDDDGEFQSGTASYQIRNEGDMISTNIYTHVGQRAWYQVFIDAQIFEEKLFQKSEMITHREINCFVPLHLTKLFFQIDSSIKSIIIWYF